MAKTNKKMWGGRFAEQTDALVEAFNASIDFDKVLAPHDIGGSIAHATMLAKVGVLSKEEKASIIEGLNTIRAEIENDRFKWHASLEDVHMNIEAALTDKIGATGKKLHTGRSRNDQVATDFRLYIRQAIDDASTLLTELQTTLVTKAEPELETIMPGMTHLQPAQPITAAFYLMAWYEMLERDFERLQDCRKRVNLCPLGSGALAGTSFNIDREMTAAALGFDKPTANALDSVSDRDFAIEFSFVASLIMMHLSRMCEELILWSSNQFNFIELPDRMCTGSSIMPQKKNPDIPELIRGKSGRVYGHLMALLTLMKSQPLAYNKDNQEDKEPIFDTVANLNGCLVLFKHTIEGLTFNKPVLKTAVQNGFTTATDLADYLVKKGLPFRDAHEVVGKTVQYCIEQKCELHHIALSRLQKFCTMIEDDVYEVLTVEGSVAARNHIGGTAPSAVQQHMDAAKHTLKERNI